MDRLPIERIRPFRDLCAPFPGGFRSLPTVAHNHVRTVAQKLQPPCSRSHCGRSVAGRRQAAIRLSSDGQRSWPTLQWPKTRHRPSRSAITGSQGQRNAGQPGHQDRSIKTAAELTVPCAPALSTCVGRLESARFLREAELQLVQLGLLLH